MPQITKACENCQGEFTRNTWKGHNPRFCSCSCRQRFMLKNHAETYTAIKKTKRINQCRYCGKDYWQRHIDKYFCDPECYSNWRKKNSPRKHHECIMCGNKYQQSKKQKNQKILVCSPLCRRRYYHEESKKIMTRKTQALESIRIFGASCERCGYESNVDCHHLDCNPKNNPLDGSNWMRLCNSCHKIAHFHIKKLGKPLSREEVLKIEHEFANFNSKMRVKNRKKL